MSRFFHNIIHTTHLEVLDPYKMFSDVLVECSRCFYTSLIRSVMPALGVASDLHSMKDCTWLHQTYFQHLIILQICLCTHSKLCPFLNSPRYPHTYSISHEYAYIMLKLASVAYWVLYAAADLRGAGEVTQKCH